MTTRIRFECDRVPDDMLNIETDGSEVWISIDSFGTGGGQVVLKERSKVQAIRDALDEWLRRNA